jgi:hypothetical protein
MPRKIQANTWTSGDLDCLASFFRMNPSDFVPGPDEWGASGEDARDDESEHVNASGEVSGDGSPKGKSPGSGSERTE